MVVVWRLWQRAAAEAWVSNAIVHETPQHPPSLLASLVRNLIPTAAWIADLREAQGPG